MQPHTSHPACKAFLASTCGSTCNQQAWTLPALFFILDMSRQTGISRGGEDNLYEFRITSSTRLSPLSSSIPNIHNFIFLINQLLFLQHNHLSESGAPGDMLDYNSHESRKSLLRMPVTGNLCQRGQGQFFFASSPFQLSRQNPYLRLSDNLLLKTHLYDSIAEVRSGWRILKLLVSCATVALWGNSQLCMHSRLLFTSLIPAHEQADLMNASFDVSCT